MLFRYVLYGAYDGHYRGSILIYIGITIKNIDGITNVFSVLLSAQSWGLHIKLSMPCLTNDDDIDIERIPVFPYINAV